MDWTLLTIGVFAVLIGYYVINILIDLSKKDSNVIDSAQELTMSEDEVSKVDENYFDSEFDETPNTENPEFDSELLDTESDTVKVIDIDQNLGSSVINGIEDLSAPLDISDIEEGTEQEEALKALSAIENSIELDIVSDDIIEIDDKALESIEVEDDIIEIDDNILESIEIEEDIIEIDDNALESIEVEDEINLSEIEEIDEETEISNDSAISMDDIEFDSIPLEEFMLEAHKLSASLEYAS